MEEQAVRGFSWTFFGLGVNKALATATTIALAALLSPTDFGVVAVGLIVVNFVSWFGGSSFGATLIVHQDLDERGQGTVLSLSLLGAVGAAAVILALSPVVASTLAQPRLTGVLSALTISLVISGIAAFYESLLQNRLEFRRRFVAQTTQTVTFTVVSIALAALGAGVWSLVVGQALAISVFTFTLVALAPVRIRPAWDRDQVGVLFRTGRGFALQGITAFARQNVDVIFIGRAFNAASVGFYTMTFRVGDLTYSALADPIARVTFPAFARGLARGDDVRPAFLTVLRLVALLTVPCGVILSGASAPFTRLFFDADWAPMIGVLSVVGIWAAIRPVEATMGWLLNSLGRATEVGRVAVFVIVPLVIGLFVVVGFGDLALVVVVPVADTLISLAILAVLIGRHGGLPAAVLARALSPVVAAGAGGWAGTRIVAEQLDSAPPLVALAAASAAGGVVFVLIVAVLDRPLIRLATTQGARILGRRATAE